MDKDTHNLRKRSSDSILSDRETQHRQQKSDSQSTQSQSQSTVEVIVDHKPSAETSVWFQLVDNDGNPYNRTTADKIDCTLHTDVADFRREVKRECSNALASFDSLQLVVFRNKVAFDKRNATDGKEEPLNSSHSIEGLGRVVGEALYVVVPASSDVESNYASKEQQAAEIDLQTCREYFDIAQKVSLEESAIETIVKLREDGIFDTAVGNGLFIRKEYAKVKQIIDKTLALDNNFKKILVLGSPGIGKSVFGVLLFFLAIKEEKNVAYRPINSLRPCFFTWNRTTGKHDIANFARPGVTYVGYFDGNDDGKAMNNSKLFNPAYLFASPRTKNYNEFGKDGCFKVYLNPWSKAECVKFSKLLGLKEEQWLWKFNLVGGKPRYVFSSDRFDYLRETVYKGIPGDLDTLKAHVRLFIEGKFNDDMKHITITLYRNKNHPSCYFLTYSSLIVEAKISAFYENAAAEEFRNLLKTPAANLQSWRGKEIEKFLLQDLATAMFRVKPLEGPNVSVEIELGPFVSKSKIIESASEIEDQLMLYIPLAKNFPAIDGVLVVPNRRLVIYAQSTVSNAHPIKYHYLKDLYNNLTKKARFRAYQHILLFIVPKDVYGGFSFQPYKNIDGKNRATKIDIEIQQYVGANFDPNPVPSPSPNILDLPNLNRIGYPRQRSWTYPI